MMTEIDAPITDLGEDILFRRNFSDNIATTLVNWKYPQSLVVGIYGPWGCGKTTVLSFIEQLINKRFENEKVINKSLFVKFNPWNYQNESQLLLGFLTELSSLFLSLDTKSKTKISHNLEEFWERFQVFQEIPRFGFLIKVFAKWRFKERTLTKIKDELISDFQKLNHKVIVFIDDIDRLSDEEIKRLFQIIKNNADFPNTIYVLAFDREIVEKALCNVQGISGRKYLEKIVQVGFDIPIIEEEVLEDYLKNKINEIFLNQGININNEYLEEMYRSGFFDFFTTLRDIKRYLNSLNATLNIIQGELNPVDFLALEVIRVFIPNLYNSISNNKNLFLNNGYKDNEQEKKFAQEQIRDIYEMAGDYKNQTIRLLHYLFPQLNSVRSNIFYTIENQEEWRKYLRICSKDFFDIYFLLKVPISSISQNEIQNLISDITHANLFCEKLSKYGDKVNIILTRLPDLFESNNQNLDEILDGLLLFANLQVLYEPRILWIPPDRKALFAIQKILNPMEINIKEKWLKNKIQTESKLYGIVHLVANMIDPKRYLIQKDFSENQLLFFKKSMLERIILLSSSDRFIKQKGLVSILYRWKEWDENKENLQAYIEKITETNSVFAEFISSFIGTSITTSGNMKYITERYIDHRTIENFLSKEEIQRKLDELIKSNYKGVNPEHMEGIQLLQKSLNNPEYAMGPQTP